MVPERHNSAGYKCCDDSDGYPVDYEMRPDNQYWVHFQGHWFPVPDNAVRRHVGDPLVMAWLGVRSTKASDHRLRFVPVADVSTSDSDVASPARLSIAMIHAAVSTAPGRMRIPNPNYLAPGSFGSLELKLRDGTEFIGQAIDYSEARMVDVSAISLDAFNFPRLDLIKMDVEGMELEALAGAIKSIQAHRPMMLIEALKVDGGKLRAWLEELNYSVLQSGINLLAIHKEDECLKHLKIEQQKSA